MQAVILIKGKTNMKLSTKVLKQSGVGLAALAVLVAPVAASAASDSSSTVINANIGSTITVSSDSPVTLNLTPGGGAVLSSASDTVSVSTNNSAGYNLTLANADATTSLQSGSNTIVAHAGTHAAPTALADNSWGYAVAGGAFDASYSEEDNASGSTTKWAGVPASTSPVQIKQTSSTATSDQTIVWYGVKVNSAQPTGTYTDTVTYTATTR